MIIADATSTDLTSIGQFIQFGFVGVVLFMLIKGIGIVTRRELDHAQKEIAELKTTNSLKDEIIQRQNKVMEEKVIPALVRATDIAAKNVRRASGVDGHD